MDPHSTKHISDRLLEASQAMVDDCDREATKVLRKIGFEIPNQSDLNWADIIFSLPNINWSTVSKIIIFTCEQVLESLEKNRPFPNAMDFHPIISAKFSDYYAKVEQLSITHTRSYLEEPKSLTLKELALFAPSTIANYMLCNLADLPKDPETRKTTTHNFQAFLQFFKAVKMIADVIPENSSEIMEVIKNEILELKPVLLHIGTTDSFWLRMIFFGMESGAFNETLQDLQEICEDRKKAQKLYQAYKNLFLSERDNDFEGARERIDQIFKMPSNRLTQLLNILEAAGSSSVETYNFYLEFPAYTPLLERIAKLNIDQDSRQQCTACFVDYFSKPNNKIQDLILAVASDPKKLVVVLNPNLLSILEGVNSKFFVQVQDFLLLSRDLNFYSPLIQTLEKEDLPRAQLIMDGISYLNTTKDPKIHEKRILLINRLVAMTEEQLPATIDQLNIASLTTKVVTEKTPPPLNISSLPKRKSISFDSPEVEEAYPRFQTLDCSRLFLELVKNEGESSSPVKLAIEDLNTNISNPLYRTFISDHKLRKLYFQQILPSPEFHEEFEARLALATVRTGNFKFEAELLKKWIQSRQTEQGSSEEAAPIEQSNSVIQKFRAPNFFERILIMSPTERVRLDLERIQESIPNLPRAAIQIINSENRNSVGETARNLAPDRLILYMTSNCSHSEYLSMLARVPTPCRSNIYNFHGTANLYQLLSFLNQWRETFSQMKDRKI